MIVFLTEGGVLNTALLKTKTAPRRVLSLGLVPIPRSAPWRGVFWRALIEHPLARYSLALSPFLALLALRPDLAMVVSEGALVMLLAVFVFERYVLGLPGKAERRALMPPDAASAATARFEERAQAVLNAVASARGLETGRLHLVVEQSRYLRLPPLTLISVQHEGARPTILALNPVERARVAHTLFPDAGDERALHLASLAETIKARVVTQDLRAGMLAQAA